MGTMQAAVLHGFEELRLEEVKIPEPANDGDVLVRIRSCGICATDYKAFRGIRRNVTFPSIIGHEPSGVVAAVGRGVRRLREGDEVIVQPLGHCGLCDHCRSGNTHYCERAFVMGGDGPPDVRPGAFAEYMIAPEGSLFKKPSGVSFDAAALTEPLAGAWKGTIQYSRMRVGDDVVVIGVGSIGLLCLMVARAAGAGRLIAIDTSDWALGQAANLGASHTVNPTREDAKRRVYEIMSEGPDLVIEAAGPIEAVRLMVELRRLGTNWNLFGITTHESFELDGGRTHFLEGRLNASFGTNTLSMVQAIRLMERGLVDTEKIITHRYPLARIHEAMETMASKDRNKVMIHP